MALFLRACASGRRSGCLARGRAQAPGDQQGRQTRRPGKTEPADRRRGESPLGRQSAGKRTTEPRYDGSRPSDAPTSPRPLAAEGSRGEGGEFAEPAPCPRRAIPTCQPDGARQV